MSGEFRMTREFCMIREFRMAREFRMTGEIHMTGVFRLRVQNSPMIYPGNSVRGYDEFPRGKCIISVLGNQDFSDMREP